MIEELRKYIITEHDLQNMESIECSLSGEMIPFEIVESSFDEFIKSLKKEIYEDDFLGWRNKRTLKHYSEIIDKMINIKTPSSSKKELKKWR